MIDIATNRIVQNGKEENIKTWEVWFKNPFGVTPSLEESNATVVNSELSPNLVTVPVPVAVSETMHEVFDR
jgi:hypothetical protein